MEFQNFVLDNFQIDFKNIIQGGEANIFIGSHSSHGKVAVKKWNKNYYDNNKETVLKREIEILMKNPHQHIIEVIGFLVDERSNCIGYVMPYMDIGSLEDVIHNKENNYDHIYTDEQKSIWITQICRGLSHLHSTSIIHRDIKPRVVYNDVKLSDFGIARSVVNITHSLTTSMGTDFYMAPEVFKGEIYTFSADIYSLSITIWEILYRSHITCKFDLLSQINSGVRPELNNDLSEEVSDFLTRCWDDDAIQRPKINEALEFYSNIRLTPFERTEIKQEKQTILLLGGRDGGNNDSLLILENNGQDWKELSLKLPHGIYSHGAQFLNNHLYVFGGYNSNDHGLNWTYKLSKSLKWEKMADMNKKRGDISNNNVILNNQIWVCGGMNENKSLRSVEMYDPLTNKWKYMKKMNECLGVSAAFVVNGKIFSGDFRASIQCYNPSSDNWTVICQVPQSIKGYRAAEIDGNFIVMGEEYFPNWNNVWALDITNKNAKWIKKPSMPTPCGFFNIAKVDNKIFVYGGVGKSDNINIFDGEIWRNGPKTPTSRINAPLVLIPMEFSRYLKKKK